MFRSALVGDERGVPVFTTRWVRCPPSVSVRSVAMAPEAIAPPNLGSLGDGRESPSGLAGLVSADRMPRAELSASIGPKGDGGVATHRHTTMLRR